MSSAGTASQCQSADGQICDRPSGEFNLFDGFCGLATVCFKVFAMRSRVGRKPNSSKDRDMGAVVRECLPAIARVETLILLGRLRSGARKMPMPTSAVSQRLMSMVRCTCCLRNEQSSVTTHGRHVTFHDDNSHNMEVEMIRRHMSNPRHTHGS